MHQSSKFKQDQNCSFDSNLHINSLIPLISTIQSRGIHIYGTPEIYIRRNLNLRESNLLINEIQSEVSNDLIDQSYFKLSPLLRFASKKNFLPIQIAEKAPLKYFIINACNIHPNYELNKYSRVMI
jgi:hypothetical protein